MDLTVEQVIAEWRDGESAPGNLTWEECEAHYRMTGEAIRRACTATTESVRAVLPRVANVLDALAALDDEFADDNADFVAANMADLVIREADRQWVANLNKLLEAGTRQKA